MSATGSIFTLASAAVSATSNSGDLDTSAFDEIQINVDATAKVGTPSFVFTWQEKDLNGKYFTVWTSSALTDVGQVHTSVGPGCETARSVGQTGKLTWTLTSTTSLTFSVSIIGRVKTRK